LAKSLAKSINIDFGTSAADGAVPPAITQRAEGNNYIKLENLYSGKDLFLQI